MGRSTSELERLGGNGAVALQVLFFSKLSMIFPGDFEELLGRRWRVGRKGVRRGKALSLALSLTLNCP